MKNLLSTVILIALSGTARALPATPDATGCHLTSVFSLRYRPWGKVIPDNQHSSISDVQNRS